MSGANTSGQVGLSVSGMIIDPASPYSGTPATGMNVVVSYDSYTINEDIKAGVIAILSASPYSLTFAAGDTVRLLPESG